MFAWGQPQGHVGPSAEVCNGLDDDCNGLTDDGITCTPPCAGGDVCNAALAGPLIPMPVTAENGVLCTGAPVDLRSGQAITNPVDDVVLADPFTPIAFTRRWSSTLAVANENNTTGGAPSTTVRGALGGGWVHSYEDTITYDPPPAGGSQAQWLTGAFAHWVTGDGATITFVQQSDGGFPPPLGRTEQLMANYDASEWTMMRADGTVAHYPWPPRDIPTIPTEAPLWRLEFSRSPGYPDLSINLCYYGAPPSGSCASEAIGSECYSSENYAGLSSANRAGLLCEVSTTSGRTLFLNYGRTTGRQLVSLAAPGQTNTLTTFDYDTATCADAGLAGVATSDDGLTTEQCPTGTSPCCAFTGSVHPGAGEPRKAQIYRYDTTQSVPMLRYVADGDQVIVEQHTWTDSTVQKSQTVDADLTYTGGSGTATVTDARSGTAAPRTYTVTMDVVGNLQSVGGTGQDCACSIASMSVSSGSVSTGGGELNSETDARGDVTMYQYDPTTARVTNETVNGTENSATTQTSLSYNGTTQLLDSTVRPSLVSTTSCSYDPTQCSGDMPPPGCVCTSYLRPRGGTFVPTALSLGVKSTGFTQAAPGYQTRTSGISISQEAGATVVTYSGPRHDYPETVSTILLSNGMPWQVEIPVAPSTQGPLDYMYAAGFDIFGHPYLLNDPNNNVYLFTYWPEGSLHTVRMDPGDGTPSAGLTTITYTPGGRIHQINYPTGVTDNYSYTFENRSQPKASVGGQPAGLLESMATTAADGTTSLVTTSYTYVAGATELNQNLVDTVATQVPSGTGTATTFMSQFQYDDQRRPNMMNTYRYPESGASATTTWQLDPLGQIVSQAVPFLVGTSPPSVTTYYYQLPGQLSQMLVNGSQVGAFSYDTNGNLTSATYAGSGGSPLQLGQIGYLYDDFGNPVQSSSLETGATTYQYDEADNVAATTDAAGRTTSYSYDSVNRITGLTATDPKAATIQVTYSYDDPYILDTMPDDCIPSSTENLPAVMPNTVGRLARVADDSGTTYLAYNASGLPTVEARQDQGSNCARITQYTWNPNNLLSTVRYASGLVATYGYPAGSSADPRYPSSVTLTLPGGTTAPLASNITYDMPGRVASMTFQNGVRNAYAYFLDGLPWARQATGAGRRLMDRDVGWTDPDGAPTTIGGVDYTEYLTYDPVYRTLQSATYSPTAGNMSLYGLDTFDAANVLGRRSSFTDSYGDSDSYVYGGSGSQLNAIIVTTTQPHWLSPSTPSVFSYVDALGYDADGSLKSVSLQATDGATRVRSSGTYDALGRLASWNGTEFLYDYRGLRAAKISAVNSGPAHYTYDDSGRLLEETECEVGNSGPEVSNPYAAVCTDTLTQDYIYVAGEIIGVVQTFDNGFFGTSKVYYVSSGLLGEPLMATDGSGNVVWRGEHDPFGNAPQPQVSPPPNDPSGNPEYLTINIGLSGCYFDSESAYYYCWHRYYDPATGRYLQVDPLVETAGRSLLRVGQEPVTADDLTQDILGTQDAPLSAPPETRTRPRPVTLAPGLSAAAYTYGGANPLVRTDATGLQAGAVAAGAVAVGGIAFRFCLTHPNVCVAAGRAAGVAAAGAIGAGISGVINMCKSKPKKQTRCWCTCLGVASPPSEGQPDRRFGDRSVGTVDYDSACRAECVYRGFSSYQCS